MQTALPQTASRAHTIWKTQTVWM